MTQWCVCFSAGLGLPGVSDCPAHLVIPRRLRPSGWLRAGAQLGAWWALTRLTIPTQPHKGTGRASGQLWKLRSL